MILMTLFATPGRLIIPPCLVLLATAGCTYGPTGKDGAADADGNDPEEEQDGADDSSPPPDGEENIPPADPVRLVTNGEYIGALMEIVGGATESVQADQLELLTGDLPRQVFGALAAAAARGVRVTVLLDADVTENQAWVQSLTDAGIEARLGSQARTLHVKLVVADRAKALVGSTNWSASSMMYNNEANWLVTDATAAEALAGYSDRLWSSDSTAQAIDPGAVGGLTLMGDGQYGDLVRPIIEGASRRVRLVMYEVTYDTDPGTPAGGLVRALVDAQGRGVDVEVVLELSDFDDTLNGENRQARSALAAAGVGVRFDTVDTTTHAKLLVVDDVVVLYSGNWTSSSLTRNHEAGALFASPAVAAEAVEYFDTIWATGQ